VIKGPQSYTLTHKDVEEVFEEVRDKGEVLEAKRQKEFVCVQEIYREIIFIEYQRQTNTIQNLNDFLLYLPLVDLHDLGDALYRIRGNIGKNTDYVLQQLGRLYRDIPNLLARECADQYRYFFLEQLSVYNIINETKEQHKREKYRKYCEWDESGAAQTTFAEYKKACDIFIKKLNVYDQLNLFLQDIECGEEE